MNKAVVSSERKRRQRRADSADRKNRTVDPRLVRGALLGALTWCATLFLFIAGGDVQPSQFAVGQRAPQTIVATVGFTCNDYARTGLLKQKAAEEVVPVFLIDPTGFHTASRTLARFYERMEQLHTMADEDTRTPEATRGAVTDALFLLGLPLTADDAEALAPAGREKEIMGAIRDTLESVAHRGVISQSEQETRYGGIASDGRIALRMPETEPRAPTPLDDIFLPAQATAFAADAVRGKLPDLNLPAEPLATLLRQWIAPNLRYDDRTTQSLRDGAAGEVATATMNVAAGHTLVEAGERVTAPVIERITAHQQRRAQMESPRDRFLDRLGQGGLLLLSLAVAVGMLRIVAREYTTQPKFIALFSLAAFTVLLPAKALLLLSAASSLIPQLLIEPLVPLGLAPLLTVVFASPGAALVVGLWTSAATALLLDQSFSALLLGLIVTVVVAGGRRRIRKRSQLMRMGLAIGLAAVALVLCKGAMHQQPAQVLVPQLVAALAGGMLTALLAAVCLPIVEWAFRLTSDITLLELSDLSHEVLQRVAIEAPGTYHHSLMVAQLAQAAAQAIGAHGLLVRVCAYFHDIGKLSKPEMFVENTQHGLNRHDDLQPSMSALVIIAHVKEGVALAERHKLPQPILDGIAQHHGTSLISFFYHRAKKAHIAARADGAAAVPLSEEAFRYPGPRPQSPEMGILLLADSVEAASRSMEKPTAARIESLVNDIVDSRMQDGQLNQCNLTFPQLQDIKSSFMFSLTNMLHGRIAYPKSEDQDPQPTTTPPDQPSETDRLMPVAHGAD